MVLQANILNKFINKNDFVYIGVSGGADSMCLLSLVEDYRKNVDFEFMVVHINHGLRDKEALRDEDFVRQYCALNNINFKSIKIKTKEYSASNGKTIEQAGRELRYLEFRNLLKEKTGSKLLVAHHSADQAETILMHIARGSSLRGASGMLEFAGDILRPLLNVSKKDILEYNEKNNVPFVEDSSNKDDHYSRNFVRLNILPKLKEIYPNVETSLCNFATICSRDDDFIRSMVPTNILTGDNKKAVISEGIVELHPALSTRIIKMAFEQMNVFADMEEKHISKILELFTLKNGAKINLPNGLLAYKEYGAVVISKGKKIENKESFGFKFGQIKLESFGSIVCSRVEDSANIVFEDGVHYVDVDKIPQSAVWRMKKVGDVFSKLGTGSKKLVDYMTDKKIPQRLRDCIPVLADGNVVYVVAGYDISERVKITHDTENVAKLVYYKQI